MLRICMLHTTGFHLSWPELVDSAMEQYAKLGDCTAGMVESACLMSQAQARQPADVASAMLVTDAWDSLVCWQDLTNTG